MIASFARAVEPGTRHQSEDGGEVAEAGDGRGHEDRAVGTAVHRADGARGGDGRRLPKAHAPATGRLSLCPAVVDPASDTVGIAQVLAASRHLASSGCRGRQTQAPEVQALPDRRAARPSDRWRARAPLHIDIAEVQTTEGKLYLFVGIDRTAKFAVAQRVATADRRTAWEFLQHMLEAVPYQVRTVFTDSGIQFAEQPRNRNTISSRPMRFDMICEANGIEHRLTKPNHP